MATREATRKQKQLASVLMANSGISTAKAMIQAGYSKVSARNPQAYTNSLGFAELAQKLLPDNKLVKIAKQGLNATKTVRYKGQEFQDIDYYARHQYLDTALRIRGLAQSTDTPIGDITINVINYGDTTPPIKSIDIKETAGAGSPPSVESEVK